MVASRAGEPSLLLRFFREVLDATMVLVLAVVLSFASGSFVMNVANVALKEHAARVCARGLASEAPSHAS